MRVISNKFENMGDDLLPIVQFGKYKGKSVLELQADTNYVEWLKQQSWFPNQKQIYNIIVHQTIFSSSNNSKTPEHNRLQNLFLDKSNQSKLVSNLMNTPSMDNIKQLSDDKDFIKHFGKNIIEPFNYKLDTSKIIFEDKFNWDFVLYYKDSQSITFLSNIEDELIDKIKYRKQYDLEQHDTYQNNIILFHEKIKVREIIDKELLEKYENEEEFYEENKLINEILYNDYLKSLQKYNKIKDEFQESAMKSLLIKLSGTELLQIDDNIKNIMDIWKLENKEPAKILKLKEPTEFNINVCIELSKQSKSPYFGKYYEGYAQYIDTLKCDFIQSVSRLKRELEEYKHKYKENCIPINYEKTFEKQYEKYRTNYYSSIVKKYIVKHGFDIDYINENQYRVSIDLCNYSRAICAEVKPTLSDDYPCVLRKLKTQIELTKNDKTTFQHITKNYILIIENFTSVHVSKDELITIFKQAGIIIIFANNIFNPSTSVKTTYENTEELIKEIQLLKDRLLKQDKQIKLLEDEVLIIGDIVTSLQ